jgi:predicted nucleotidyltransferase
VLRDRFGATRVRLFGSLARGDGDVDRGFDIDLAVEGVAPGKFFEAWAVAARQTKRRLDVVDVKDASPLLRQRFDEDGIDLP